MSVPVIPRRGPYLEKLEAGRQYYWCSCGLSARQPFCDGAHKGHDCPPVPFRPESDGRAALCGCKKTANPPYCDGRHGELPPDAGEDA